MPSFFDRTYVTLVSEKGDYYRNLIRIKQDEFPEEERVKQCLFLKCKIL